jgi:DNA-binding transcriptional LysR family regulator
VISDNFFVVEAKIDLNRVALFVEVVENGSFSAAARRARLPVSSVSRGVARLEDALGVRLLQRTTRKLALTEAGRDYFARMRTVIGEARAATSAVAGRAQEPRGVVRITAPPGLQHLASLLAEIVGQYPELQIDLSLTMRSVDLVEEGMDLAIRGGNLEDSSLIAHRIGASDFLAVAAPSYLKVHGVPRTPGDLKQHACIGFRTRAGLLPWRLAGPAGKREVAVRGPLVCDDLSFVRQAALEGAGIGLLPRPLVIEELRARRLTRVLPRWSMAESSLYVLWPSRRLLPARVAVVRDHLVAGLTRLFGDGATAR